MTLAVGIRTIVGRKFKGIRKYVEHIYKNIFTHYVNINREV